jgi:hypothetical protein
LFHLDSVRNSTLEKFLTFVSGDCKKSKARVTIHGNRECDHGDGEGWWKQTGKVTPNSDNPGTNM